MKSNKFGTKITNTADTEIKLICKKKVDNNKKTYDHNKNVLLFPRNPPPVWEFSEPVDLSIT